MSRNLQNSSRPERKIKLLPNRIAVRKKLHKLRYKYAQLKESDPEKARKRNEQLDKIIWYSAPVTYPYYDREDTILLKAESARKQKKKRANKVIRAMFECYDELYWITLTWSPQYLDGLKENVRRKYVQQFLNDNCRYYCANIDYGSKKQREHFHAVVAWNRSEKMPEWKYGWKRFKRIRKPESNEPYRITGYMLKLVNHAGKVTSGSLLIKRGMMEDIDELPF